MDHDILFLLALVLAPLAAVSLVSAWADRRRPVVGATLALIATGLVVYVWWARPGGLPDWRALPELTLETLARLLN